MRRLASIFLTACVFVTSRGAALAQNAHQTSQASKEWPTYGHDPGAMRFSPLTQLTPANVSQLKVAWVYHMRPPGEIAPAGRGLEGRGPASTTAAGPEGEVPPAARGGRGRGRFGSGFRPS